LSGWRKSATYRSAKDFQDGQTMMKSVLAPAFKARMLGSVGMVFHNILAIVTASVG